MGIADDEFESLREQLATCDTQDRDRLVDSLIAQGKLEQVATGVKYVFIDRRNPLAETGGAV